MPALLKQLISNLQDVCHACGARTDETNFGGAPTLTVQRCERRLREGGPHKSVYTCTTTAKERTANCLYSLACQQPIRPDPIVRNALRAKTRSFPAAAQNVPAASERPHQEIHPPPNRGPAAPSARIIGNCVELQLNCFACRVNSRRTKPRHAPPTRDTETR